MLNIYQCETCKKRVYSLICANRSDIADHIQTKTIGDSGAPGVVADYIARSGADIIANRPQSQADESVDYWSQLHGKGWWAEWGAAFRSSEGGRILYRNIRVPSSALEPALVFIVNNYDNQGDLPVG